MKDDNVLEGWEEKDQANLDKKSARRMVWRTRLSIGFTVIRTILLIFLIYIAYMIPVGMYYDMSGKQGEFDRIITTLIETRYPGVEVNHMFSNHAGINSFLTQSTTLKLYRNVGEWDVVIGEVQAEKHLFGKVSYSLNFDEKYLNENKVRNFAIPPKILGRESSNAESGSKEHLRKQLTKIDDGHVAQAQFSVKTPMKSRALLDKLEAYDIQVYRMPVYGGELTEFETSSHGSGQLTFVQSLLLRPQITYDDKNRHSSSVSPLNKVTIEQSIDQFYEDIKWLTENGNYSGKDIDQKRLKYLRENGIKVYGAVVTGPIREIEKLLDEEQFHQFYLGGVEVWNWYEN
ncbi:Sigma factor regulator N-terminal [Virgibacillus subterraneus]|uniref:Sigma factor regulator N-terminal n=1 Tax=Virgibacillus subterraneus TaxID=621109 RepID=A0A1H9BP48_9BACI|nr:anti sigma factor C-terminal domain-containing protein [Virgibacillus subterraneus]SEP90313.1 Sigma factor regulator N-terminal [Virgibacillus subterraneus]